MDSIFYFFSDRIHPSTLSATPRRAGLTKFFPPAAEPMPFGRRLFYPNNPVNPV
jgi:hypothetical protein